MKTVKIKLDQEGKEMYRLIMDEVQIQISNLKETDYHDLESTVWAIISGYHGEVVE